MNKKGIIAHDYWNVQNSIKKEYKKNHWTKLSFDGKMKRIDQRPSSLAEVVELARSRFGVLRHVLKNKS